MQNQSTTPKAKCSAEHLNFLFKRSGPKVMSKERQKTPMDIPEIKKPQMKTWGILIIDVKNIPIIKEMQK